MNDDQSKKDPVKIVREEVRDYYGIEYKLKLCIEDAPDNQAEADMGSINKRQWWCLEYTDKSKKLALYAGGQFLWADTRQLAEYRMQDKYHACEMHAMGNINWIYWAFPLERFKWLSRETYYYIWVMAKTFVKRIGFVKEKWPHRHEAKKVIIK